MTLDRVNVGLGSKHPTDMPANASPPRPASSSKSSPRARIRSALLFCRADGWSSGSLPGSAVTEGLPKISRPASTPPGPSFTPLPSCCSHAASRGTHEFRNRLLGPVLVRALARLACIFRRLVMQTFYLLSRPQFHCLLCH